MDKLDSGQVGKVVDINDGETITEAHPSVHTPLPFTQVPNEIIYNPRLSCRSRCLLIYMLSQIPGWQFHDSVLRKYLDCGQVSLKEAFAELRAEGYVRNEKLRKGTGKGSMRGEKRIFSRTPIFGSTEIVPPKVFGSTVFRPPKKYTTVNHTPENEGFAQAPCGFPESVNNTISFNNTIISNKNINACARTSSFLKEFEEFWQYYPKKISKGKARDKYNALLSKDYNLHEIIIAALKAQNLERMAKQSKNLWQPEPKHPATWLNAECWNDEVITNQEQLDDEVRRSDSGKSGISHKSAKFSDVMRESRKRSEAAMRSAGLTPRTVPQLTGPAHAGTGTPAIQQVQALLPGELDKRD